MAQKVRAKSVRYILTESVEIEPGVTLPPGTYHGVMKEVGVETFKGITWAAPRYGLELSATTLAAMGAKIPTNLTSTDYDLAKFVRLEKIQVC